MYERKHTGVLCGSLFTFLLSGGSFDRQLRGFSFFKLKRINSDSSIPKSSFQCDLNRSPCNACKSKSAPPNKRQLWSLSAGCSKLFRQSAQIRLPPWTTCWNRNRFQHSSGCLFFANRNAINDGNLTGDDCLRWWKIRLEKRKEAPVTQNGPASGRICHGFF